MSRADTRTHFDTTTRLTLLEADVDELHQAVDNMTGRLDKILWVLVGLLVSVATSCILLAINIGVGA